MIPAFARHAVYLAKAAELRPAPKPPVRGAPETVGFGVVAAFVAAFAGITLMVSKAIAAREIADFLKVMV